MQHSLRVQKLSPLAQIPRRATPDAVGYDVTSIEHRIIAPGDTAIVPTGLAIAIPDGTYARVAPRSGLAATYGIGVGAGVIDPGYRGEVKVVLFNHGKESVTIRPGDRIAQLVFEMVRCPSVIECDALDVTIRGDGGFGSTGM